MFIVSQEKSELAVFCTPICYVSFSLAFLIFSLSLVFNSFSIMCLGGDLFVFSYLGLLIFGTVD